jgi:uncharacterized repeat protein (TIGR02059 family)
MKKLLVIPFLLICIIGNATNYYVRAGGSDSSTGLSDAAAWASVAKVNSSMSLFKPGDAILFRRGDTWTNVTILIGIGGIQGNNITIGAYGTGAKPVISAPANNPAIKVTAANRGYWTIDNLDLRSTGIPSSAYSTMAIQHSYWLTDMGPVPGWIIQNCTFNCCVMLSGPNTLVRNNIFNGSLNTNNRGGAITFRGPECKNVIVEYNDISNYYDRGVWIYNGGTSPVFRYNKISNIKKGGDHGGSGINVDGYGKRVTYGEVYGNNISNIDMYAITFENGYYASVYNNRTDNGGGVMIWQYPVNGDGSNYAGTGNMDIHHNVFHNGNVGIVLYNAANMKIANNDFVKDNAASTNEGALLVTGSTTSVSGISFVNNIVAGTWPHVIKLPDSKNIWSTFDYNDVIPVGSEIVNGGGSQSLSQLQASGYMTHGITTDPKFVSATSDWKLQQTSPAINKGTSLGYTTDFDGRTIDAQPDMGALEYAGIVQTPVSPVYSGSVIQNTSPSVLEMTFNMTLANILPSTSAFNVTVNSVARTVSAVAISGSKVLLTLASPAKSGESLTVAYTKPSTNPLQSTLGGTVESLSAQPVTNNITATVAVPQFVSAAVQNATPSVLEMTYNMTLANILPASGAFTVTVNSTARTVSSVAVSGSIVKLTLASPVKAAETVTVAYTKPATNPLQTTDGGQAETIAAKPVTNNVTAAVALPQFVSAAVQNAAPAVLEMTYNMTLASILPAASAFTVTVNSTARSVSSVSVSGTMVKLTLASPVKAAETVTVAYTKPATNPLQATDGSQAESIAAKPVTNNVAAIVVAPQFVSAAVQNATPSLLEMTYNMTLASILPATSAFTVTVNSTARSVSSVAVSGTMVKLTLASPVKAGETVSVAYTKPATNPLQTTDGGQAESLATKSVTNNVSSTSQVGVPKLTGASVSNETPTIVNMSYDMTLANIVPPASAFTVKINSEDRTINTVSISGSTVSLTLASRVFYGDNINVSYTQPAQNQLQNTTGGLAASITSQPVTNNVDKLTDGNITISPNPARSYIYVTVKEPTTNAQTIRLYNIHGSLMLEAKLNPYQTRIELSLRRGVYIARVYSGQIILYTKKLFIL